MMTALLRLVAIAAAAWVMVPASAAAPATATPAPTTPAQAAPNQAPRIGEPAQRPEATAPPTTAAANAPTSAADPNRLAPVPGIGQPDGRMGLSYQATALGRWAVWFHDIILLPIIIVISLFVLGLMLWVIVRFRRSAHPVPSRTTHNMTLEIVWTLVPAAILVAIAFPSLKLLSEQYTPPRADLTVKVTGNQWYWTYQYPDHGDFEIISKMLPDAEAAAAGEPRLLAVDNRMVVPVGATVKLIITASDVIHAWGVPAFWVKLDAVPGRLNETWFKPDREGLYYGQCFELCGADHAYMPIAVEVVSPARFAAWIGSQGGTMTPPAPGAPNATAGSPVTDPRAAPAAAPASASPDPAPQVTPGTTTPPVTSQGAQSSRGKQ